MRFRVQAGLLVLIALAVVPMHASGQEEESAASPQVWTADGLANAITIFNNSTEMEVRSRGYNMELVVPVAKQACEASVYAIQASLGFYNTLRNQEVKHPNYQDGKLIFSEEKYAEFLDDVLMNLQLQTGLSDLSECAIRSVLWSAWYQNPEGIPLDQEAKLIEAGELLCAVAKIATDDGRNWSETWKKIEGNNAAWVTLGGSAVGLIPHPVAKIISVLVIAGSNFILI